MNTHTHFVLKKSHWLVLGIFAFWPAMATPPNAETKATPFEPLSLEQALEKAKDDSKLVILDFFAEWCGPCKRMDKTTWVDPKLLNWAKDKIVAIRVDADQNRELPKRFRIYALPTIIFLSEDGRELGRLSGFKDTQAFLDMAKVAASKAQKSP